MITELEKLILEILKNNAPKQLTTTEIAEAIKEADGRVISPKNIKVGNLALQGLVRRDFVKQDVLVSKEVPVYYYYDGQ